MAKLRLSLTADTGATLISYLRQHLLAAHSILRPPLAELSVALVGDRRMSQLHEQFLGIPGPTDVLTFPLELDRRGRPVSGEVVVCVPEARRRGKAERTGLKREVLLYALHGLLHLSGYDDRTRAGFTAMHRTEDAILTRLGIGPVFAARGAALSGGSKRRSSLQAPSTPRQSGASRANTRKTKSPGRSGSGRAPGSRAGADLRKSAASRVEAGSKGSDNSIRRSSSRRAD